MLFTSCGAPPGAKALKILQKSISDSSVIIRLNAGRGLWETGDASGMKVIFEILNGNDKEGVVAALNVLYELEEKKYSPSVARLYQNEDPLIRAEAYRLMSRCPDSAYWDIMRIGLKDKIGKVRRHAYAGLEHMADRDALYRGLRDVDPLVRLTCAQVLGRLGEPGMENFIKKELNQNKTPEIWVEGCAGLAALKDTAAVSFLTELLEDVPWDIRIAAAAALLELNRQDGVPAIKEGLLTADPFIRGKCVEVIGQHPLPDFYEALCQATGDIYINVTIGAIRALIKYRKPESRAVFVRLLDAPNPLVQIAAASALLQCQGNYQSGR